MFNALVGSMVLYGARDIGIGKRKNVENKEEIYKMDTETRQEDITTNWKKKQK